MQKVEFRRQEVTAAKRFLQQIKEAQTMVKYGMETAGMAKQIYSSGVSAVNMLKSAFGDFQSLGDLMGIYSMGQLKLINLHRRWEMENSNYTDFDRLYKSATARYRFNGQIDPYRIMADAAEQKVSVTETAIHVFGLKQKQDRIQIAHLINAAEMHETRAEYYEEIANRLEIYSAGLTIAGPGGSLDKWLKDTEVLADRKSSIFLDNTANSANDMIQRIDGQFGSLLKGQMSKFAEKHNMSPDMLQNINTTIAQYRLDANHERTMASAYRQQAFEIGYYDNAIGSMELASAMIDEDPLLRAMGFEVPKK